MDKQPENTSDNLKENSDSQEVLTDNDEHVETVTAIKKIDDFSEKTWKEDLSLIVEGKTLYVAKNVLALASPVFAKMFEGEFQESEKCEIELSGKTYADFIEFLRCIYPSIQKKVSIENVLRLVPLAEEYQVGYLKENCETVLLDDIDTTTHADDLFMYLTHASVYNMEELKMLCLSLAIELPKDKLKSAEEHYPLPAEASKALYTMLNEKLFRDLEQSMTTEKKSKAMLNYALAGMPKASALGLNKFTNAEGATINLSFVISKMRNVKSDHVDLRGTRWWVSANVDLDYVNFSLNCLPPTNWNRKEGEWKQFVAIHIVLLNHFVGKENTCKQTICKFTETCKKHVFEDFILLNTLQHESNGFKLNGVSTVVVHIMAY